jgi:serine/threonine protein kinase
MCPFEPVKKEIHSGRSVIDSEPNVTVQMLKNFKLNRQIGQGGYEKTYGADGVHDKQGYCIKKVLFAGISDSDRELFFDEAKILRSLNHPSIVLYKSSFEENDQFYIVTEFVDGRSHSQLLSQKPSGLSSSGICSLLNQLIDGVQYLYSNKFIHRDIKPLNILLGRNGILKLCDFGIAKNVRITRKTVSVKGGNGFVPFIDYLTELIISQSIKNDEI